MTSSSPIVVIENPSSTVLECIVRSLEAPLTRSKDKISIVNKSLITPDFARIVEPIRQFPPLYFSRKSSVNLSSWNNLQVVPDQFSIGAEQDWQSNRLVYSPYFEQNKSACLVLHDYFCSSSRL